MQKYSLVDKAQAMRMAESMGCTGIHRGKDGSWMPCSSIDEMQRISKLAEGSKWREALPAKKTDDASLAKKPRRKRNRRQWENLIERPVTSIQTLANGSLVSGPASGGITASGPISMASADSDTQVKSSTANAVEGGKLLPWTTGYKRGPAAPSTTYNPQYVRDNDPDVFTDIESARFRARQIGCIGVSRRMSKTGRIVWMPCTNNTDFANRSGSTALGRRNKKRELDRSIRTIVSNELKKRKKLK
jgi:hypothetical protein